jgi:hypothetical protein
VSGSLRRALMIAVLVAILVVTGIADRLVSRTPTPVAAPATAALSTVMVTPTRHTESSAWFCAGGTGAQGGAPGTIVLTNAAGRPVHGTLTVISALAVNAPRPAPWAGAHTMAVTVPTDGQVSVGADQLGTTSLVAAAVVLDGGGVAVSQSVQSPLGWSMAPCAPSTGTNWYFAHGVTTQGGGLVLSLFNPAATDAVVNVSLVSSTAGYLAPAAYQGIDVAPGSLVTENIGDHAPDDAAIATEVSTLSGGIVATELESAGTPGDGGVSITLGSPAPASQWVFPQNTEISGGTVAFHVLNPTTHPAAVSVAIGLSQGAGAEPLAMSVPAQSLVTLNAESQTRIPTGVPYSLTFTSRGTGIVVSREVSAPAGSPAPTPEIGDTSGVPGGTTRWLLPAVVAPGTQAYSLAVVDLGTRPATATITTPSGRTVAGLAPRRVVPGSPLVIGPGLGPTFGTVPFDVVSDQPVAVELDPLPVAEPGVVVVPSFAPS